MSDLKGLFGLVTGVNFGPLVSSEICLCAKEKEERLMILADNMEEVLDISGLGSFLKHCCKVDVGIVGDLGVVLKEKNCFFGFAVAVVVLEIVADVVDVVAVELFDMVVSMVVAWAELVWVLLRLGFVLNLYQLVLTWKNLFVAMKLK